ncbi:DUF2695 domain-containing protein [Arthrobacter sp. 35W]|uniref:DUF2695 domain-containing protein n=1 Tax=Arthrobacter sp. 35W TaxID=1132441 RepID=UPI00041D4889|nr:DUF2695 domain-containing protein [Arthrobacter sp. 35W]
MESNSFDGMEAELREVSVALTIPRSHECLACYVHRMLEFGCHGTQWMLRYQELRAPRATALERRMALLGGYCDCELMMNVFDPNPRFFATDDHGEVIDQPMLACFGVRVGSTQPCSLWLGLPRPYGYPRWW